MAREKTKFKAHKWLLRQVSKELISVDFWSTEAA